MTDERLQGILTDLRRLPKEVEWVEFKENKDDPQEIGEYISALANSAGLLGKNVAWIVWGIKDHNHDVVGTTFKPRQKRIGNEEMENWLNHLLYPRLNFRIHELEVEGKTVVMFEIDPAIDTPVRFSGEEYIRVGSYKKKLRDVPQKEKALWAALAKGSFESGIAMRSIRGQQVLDLIDYPECFRLLGLPMPDGRTGILDQLAKEGLIESVGTDKYDIFNIGAILFAYSLDRFPSLDRKRIRVIEYQGKDRVHTMKEQEGAKGYAVGFEGLISYINGRLPSNEEIGQALRREVPIYPEIAIRELVANALVHQDFSISGTGPMVEIFKDRMEITNPGLPLIDLLRFMDEQPRSRNEILAKKMRRMKIVEERGTGIDKTITQIEFFQLPAPDFQATTTHTKVTMFAPKTLAQMDKGDRVRACYQHACLRWLASDRMSNASLRERLAIGKGNYPMATKILNETIEAGLIRIADTGSDSNRDRRYIPYWA
ncbi:MAG: putative DNA binding domain-containing protein [Candidatus Sumerlaeia bacterium]|nr:putative DNA binding domain-containing protein [Candidatus Sumerlaeia bacterium]